MILFITAFFKALFDFFNTKLGITIGCIIISLIAIYLVSEHGFNSGVEYQKNVYQEEYNKALITQKELQEKVISEAVEKARIEEVNKIKNKKVIEESKVITAKYKDVKMSDEDFKNYLEKIRAIK